MGSVAEPDRLGMLMATAQQGDGGAYAELLTETATVVRRILGRKIGFLGAAELDDVVQDVLLSVHAVRATYDPARPFTPWLMAITRNRVADRARRYARTSAHEIVVDDLDVTFGPSVTNASEQDSGEHDALREAIRSLPSGQREAIELLKLKELSLRDAAAASGTTVGALKVATHRAMKALRKKLHAHAPARHR